MKLTFSIGRKTFDFLVFDLRVHDHVVEASRKQDQVDKWLPILTGLAGMAPLIVDWLNPAANDYGPEPEDFDDDRRSDADADEQMLRELVDKLKEMGLVAAMGRDGWQIIRERGPGDTDA